MIKTQVEIVVVIATKANKIVNNGDVENGENIDRGPIMVTSDFYLPKDDK